MFESILDTLLGLKKVSSKEISLEELENGIKDANPPIISVSEYRGGYNTKWGNKRPEEYIESLENLGPNLKIVLEKFTSRENPNRVHYRAIISG